MQMTIEQQSKIRTEHNVWVRCACNQCGQVLGAISYTRKDEPGEWCTARCRDGADQAEKQRARFTLRKRMRQSATMRARVINITSVGASI